MNDNTSALVDYSSSSLPAISPGIVPPFGADGDITGELYRCHLCSYSGTSKSHFNSHMNTHFDHKCQFCDYTSRTEGRLKRHIRDFHSEVPPESWAGNRVIRENGENESDESVDASEATVNGSGGKSRKYKCKQCPFVASSKADFWEHSKEHIKTEKMLTCPKCNFVTEYKHHLEYHLRNHFGSKPFKCAKCNYSCVNKSMLNSHMKSHSNIYQYRCSDCSYATKYCHSLKLHLRKYQHKPATVLNLDGTPNPYPVIDVYGTRRGPRPKKSKSTKDNQRNHSSQSQPFESSLPHKPLIPSPLSPNMLSNTGIPPLVPTSMSPGLPFLYQPNPALLHSSLLGVQAISQMPKLQNHLNAESNPLYNSLTSDKPSNVDESIRFLEQMTVNPSFFNGLLAMHKNESVGPLDWHSPRDLSNPMYLPFRPSSEGERTRPESAPIRPNSKNAISPLPRSRSSPNDRFETFDAQCSPAEDSSKDVETTPLDLSSNKSNSPLSQPCEQKFNILSQHLNQLTESSILSQIFKQNQNKRSTRDEDNGDNNSSNTDIAGGMTGTEAKDNCRQLEQQQSRAQRRKGRASKLNVNRFIKISDQLSNNVSEEDSEETNDSLFEDPDVDNIIVKINNATSLLQEILSDMISLKNDSYH